MKRTKQLTKWIGLGLLLNLLIIQFIQPAHTNPPAVPGHGLDAGTNAPRAEVAAVLRAACYDCHSQETRWPWYGYVAPVSWWLADHIKDARERLSFSEWPADNPRLAKKKLHQIRDEVEDGSMPLKSYTWMHPDARLSATQRKLLTDWADAEADKITVPDSAAESEK